MSAPEPTLVDVVDGLAEAVETHIEYTHLTSQHRKDGERVQFTDCPNDPCAAWRQFVALWTRFQAGRLP